VRQSFWIEKPCARVTEGIAALSGAISAHHQCAVRLAYLRELIDDAFGLNLKIQSFETPSPCHRTLATDYPEILSWCEVPELREQLQDLKTFKW
jgi:hypothetical protein